MCSLIGSSGSPTVSAGGFGVTVIVVVVAFPPVPAAAAATPKPHAITSTAMTCRIRHSPLVTAHQAPNGPQVGLAAVPADSLLPV
jgi:hypothetical protein